MDISFEKEVKDKLTWSLKMWQTEGQKGLSMKRLINSLKYWNGRLSNAKRENNVILTFYDGVQKAYPSLQSVSDKLNSFNNDISISGYAKFKNRRFLSVSFASQETRDFVASNLKEIENFKIAYLHWVDEAIQNVITIDWLSDSTDLDIVIEYVSQYMNISDVRRDITILDNGKQCISGKVIFKGEIYSNIKIDDIPHYTVLDGLECLVTIQGRPYKCFTCSSVGHKAMQCKKAYCRVCKAILNRNHICVNLGNNVLSQDFLVQQDNPLFIEGVEEQSKNGNGNINILTKETGSKNLFQNINLSFSNDLRVAENLSDPVQSSVGSSGEKHNTAVGPIKVESPSNNSNGWFTNTLTTHSFENPIINEYIKEETRLGDPNFILIDTSSDESASDSECDTKFDEHFFDKAEWWKSRLEDCAQISRSMVKDSLVLLKTGSAEKRSVLNGKEEQSLPKQLKMRSTETRIDSEEKAKNNSLFKNTSIVSETSVSKKKKKNKRK